MPARTCVPPRPWWRRGARAAVAAVLLLVVPALAFPPGGAGAATLLSASFDADAEGFAYADDVFLGTNQPAYASGSYVSSGGYSGGGLQVSLGGIDAASISGMSGGWQKDLSLASAESGVSLSFRYRLTQSPTYEFDEHSRVMASVGGNVLGRAGRSWIDHVSGDGASSQGNSSTFEPTTGWRQHEVYVGDLSAGTHTLVIGGTNSRKDATDEATTLVIDDVVVTSGNAAPTATDVETIVGRSSQSQFQSYIQSVGGFGDRCRYQSGCAPYTSYFNALAWVEDQLEAMGYTAVRHSFTYNGFSGTNLYATKVGAVRPDQMYMMGTHLDGRGGGQAADDDGSGVALVLESARQLARSDVQTDTSVRFLFWDNEEGGLYGSNGYVAGRRSLQGQESPSGSGLYPEPTWLGFVQHDMILYDHGVGTAGASQSAHADMDVEWRAGTTKAADSMALALAWKYWAGSFAPDYPANAYNYSTNTDDTPFHPYVASVSVRENRRSLTSGSNAEWINPYYHTSSDVYANYDADDMLLGYNTLRVTLGTIATLAGARLVTPTATPTGPTPTPTLTSTPTPTHTPTATPDAELLYVSSTTGGTAGGVSFADEDVVVRDASSGAWAMYFDGSDVGVGGTDVDAFHIRADGSLLLSFDSALTVGSLGTVDDSDIVRFVPTSTGSTTAGSFEWFFDGSDVGLSTNDEDVDAIGFASDGRLVVSTLGSFSVSGASGADEDLVAFAATSWGSVTAGTWSLYFDGSDVGLSTSSSEDVNGVWIDGASGDIYLTTVGAFSVSGASGDGSDVFACAPGSLGASTTCTFGPGLYFDGSARGFAGEIADALEIVR